MAQAQCTWSVKSKKEKSVKSNYYTIKDNDINLENNRYLIKKKEERFALLNVYIRTIERRRCYQNSN